MTINIEHFKRDLKNLQELQEHADRMQQVIENVARDFTKKWQDTIFFNQKENREYKLYHASGWNHNFKFNMYKIHKKQKHKVIQENEYINLEDFSELIPTGETINDRLQPLK